MFVKLLLIALVVRVHGAAVGDGTPTEYKLKRIQDLKDLLTLSVDNTISLNAVVTAHTEQISERTQQIGELMIAMSSNKVEMDKLNAKYSEALDKIAQLEAKDQELETKDLELDAKNQQLETKDQELEAKVQLFEAKDQELEAKDQELEIKYQELETKDQELEAKNQQLETKDQELEAKVQQFEAKDQELETKYQELEAKDQELEVLTDELRADLELVENPVHILNGEETNGNPKCARVCSGSTGRGTTTWQNNYEVYVDITNCGFVKIPTITASLEAPTSNYLREVTGTSAVYVATTTGFYMVIGGNDRLDYVNRYAVSWKWNIEWVAVGFTC